jgi:hypothetical protein
MTFPLDIKLFLHENKDPKHSSHYQKGCSMRTLIHQDGEQTWFLVTELNDSDLEEAALALAYEQTPYGYGRAFPSRTPQLVESYERFAASIETLLLQKAGRVSVPWQEALSAFLDRVASLPITWFLTGSAALAVRGIPIEPGDLDLGVPKLEDGIILDHALQDTIIEPPRAFPPIGGHFTRIFLHACIEWLTGITELAGGDVGLEAFRRAEPVQWQGYTLLVPPLDIQLAVNRDRGRMERSELISQWIKQN